MKRLAAFLAVLLVSGFVVGQEQPEEAERLGWPRIVEDDTYEIIAYQPQVESWRDHRELSGERCVPLPGYYETNTTYRFRTELYSGEKGTMVWRGDSEAVNPKNRSSKVGSMAEAVVAELKNEQLIR